ncbi:MAG: hypothetical protein M1816_001179 [Peltula sp. TS41687]|nr:MAG: hypothetical protein M1816_001179 [Peltula sp. TS41687]
MREHPTLTLSELDTEYTLSPEHLVEADDQPPQTQVEQTAQTQVDKTAASPAQDGVDTAPGDNMMEPDGSVKTGEESVVEQLPEEPTGEADMVEQPSEEPYGHIIVHGFAPSDVARRQAYRRQIRPYLLETRWLPRRTVRNATRTGETAHSIPDAPQGISNTLHTATDTPVAGTLWTVDTTGATVAQRPFSTATWAIGMTAPARTESDLVAHWDPRLRSTIPIEYTKISIDTSMLWGPNVHDGTAMSGELATEDFEFWTDHI